MRLDQSNQALPGHYLIHLDQEALAVGLLTFAGELCISETIQKYSPQGGFVEMEGERCIIRACICTMSGCSAHADQQDSLNVVSGMEK